MINPIELSRRCEESARVEAARSREVARFGPFETLINPNDAMIWLNYAVPVGPLGNEPAALTALAALSAHFVASGRRPRFEFHASTWPRLAALLEQAGLKCHARHPLMVCTPGTLKPFAAPGVVVRLLNDESPDAAFAAHGMIQRTAFGMPDEPPAEEQFARVRAQLRARTQLGAIALLEGAPVGAGGIYAVGSIGELVGVATLPDARRRGVAATLSAALVAAFFAGAGDLAWLSAGDAAAQAVYANVGFEMIDERLNYIAP